MEGQHPLGQGAGLGGLFEAYGEDFEAEGATVGADAGLGGGYCTCGVSEIDDMAAWVEGDLDAEWFGIGGAGFGHDDLQGAIGRFEVEVAGDGEWLESVTQFDDEFAGFWRFDPKFHAIAHPGEATCTGWIFAPWGSDGLWAELAFLHVDAGDPCKGGILKDAEFFGAEEFGAA
jgi:hypothetical protein